MATRTWSSTGSTDMNLATNYSGAGALLETDDLVFNNTSVVNAAATAALSVQSVTIASNYTGTWVLTGYTLTCALGFSDDGITGVHNYGNGITCNGASSIVHIGSDIAVPVATSCVLTMNGTTGMILEDNKGINWFKALVLGVAAIVTNSGNGNTIFSTTGATIPLTITNGGTLTINRQITFRSASANFHSITGAPTINGTANIGFGHTGNNNTINFPAFTYTGSGLIFFQPITGSNTPTTQLTGNLNIGTSTLRIYIGSNDINLVFDTNDYSVTCGLLQWGTDAATNTFCKLYLGASTIITTSFESTTYNLNANTLYMETSNITNKGNFSVGSNTTIVPGTSLLTQTTNNGTFTLNGESLYDLTINAAGKIIDLNDAIDITGDLIVTAGTFDTATFNLTVTGNTTIDGTINLTSSTCSFGGDYTTGAASAVTITNAVFTFTKNGAVITTNGKALPQCTFNNNASINDSCTINRIIWGVDGKTLTFEAGNTFIISNLTAANWNGAAGNLNALRSSVPDTQATIDIPNNVTLSYMNPKDSNITGFGINVSDETSVDGGNNDGWNFVENDITATLETEHQLTGEILQFENIILGLFETNHSLTGEILPPLNNITIDMSTMHIITGYISSIIMYDSYKPDIVKETLDLLLYQFKEASDLKKFLGALLESGQEFEDVLNDMNSLKFIAFAIGEQLDIIGEIVGEPRYFRDDKEYRNAIYTRIFINHSCGEPETLISFIRQVIKPQDIYYVEKHPASARLTFRTNYIPKNLLINLCYVSSAGVDISTQFTPRDRKYFGFSELDYISKVKNISGFSELGYPAYEDGGTLAELIMNPKVEINI